MKKILVSVLFCVLASVSISAQTTAFTYQGSLKDGASPANGNYDFEFALFDAVSGGSQQGSTLPRNTIPVSNGIFSVSLDFGSQFPGSNRFLEIRVRLAGQSGITTLGPRQLMNSAPYSVKSLNTDNAAQLGGVAANQYVVTTDPRMSDARPPTGGSTNYIQNTNAQQFLSNFNISGNGTVGGILSGTFVNAAQYNLGGVPLIQAAPSRNSLTVGLNAGLGGIGSTGNTIVGDGAGSSIGNNSFGNSFFGRDAGAIVNGGSANTFFGDQAGFGTTTGGSNTAVGRGAALSNTQGVGNTFLGVSTGQENTIGNRNTFVGNNAGSSVVTSNSNITGSNNSLLGSNSNVGSTNLTYATAIGSDAVASLSNSIYLGRSGGEDAVRIPGATIMDGSLVIGTLGSAGATSICLNVANRVSPCSSSLRYKTNIGSFSDGLVFVNKLRPISFDWKDGGMKDVGFGAEDIAKIDPRFVTYNDKGEVEGVKYDRLSVAFVNAFKEQQEQIDTLRNTNAGQQQQIDELKKIVCSLKADAEICKTEEKK